MYWFSSCFTKLKNEATTKKAEWDLVYLVIYFSMPKLDTLLWLLVCLQSFIFLFDLMTLTKFVVSEAWENIAFINQCWGSNKGTILFLSCTLKMQWSILLVVIISICCRSLASLTRVTIFWMMRKILPTCSTKKKRNKRRSRRSLLIIVRDLLLIFHILVSPW